MGVHWRCGKDTWAATCCCILPFVSPVREEEDGQWKEEQKLEAHSDWVRDVAWAPSIGLPTSTIASCSQVSSDP